MMNVKEKETGIRSPVRPMQLLSYGVTKTRDRVVAERWKCDGKSERLQRNSVHFPPPLLLPPWCRPPSSFAWISASSS